MERTMKKITIQLRIFFWKKFNTIVFWRNNFRNNEIQFSEFSENFEKCFSKFIKTKTKTKKKIVNRKIFWFKCYHIPWSLALENQNYENEKSIQFWQQQQQQKSIIKIMNEKFHYFKMFGRYIENSIINVWDNFSQGSMHFDDQTRAITRRWCIMWAYIMLYDL